MRRHLLFVFCIGILLTAGCAGAHQAAAPDGNAEEAAAEADDGLQPYSEVIPDDAQTDAGLFTTHRGDGKLYYEIPDSLFEKELLLVTRIARTATDIGYGGEKAHTRVVRWQRQEDDRVLLREVSYENVAEPDDPIYEAVRNANFEPILKGFDVEAVNEDSNTVVIDATELYTTDVPALGLQQGRREAYQVQTLDGDRSFITSVKSFPENVEVDNVLTYVAQEPPADAETNTISLEMSHSMVMLPTDPMTPRRCDARVGYFSVEMVDYGIEGAQKATERCYITRWRLEPKDPEAYARGELVEPVEPIVYYIDPATPETWRPYLKAGVEAWQEAFEAAGFKNAILAKDPPSEEENPDWSPEDVRYSVIRYFPSETQNAYGPHVHDPRTGQILESDIGWYHNVMNLLRNWYFVQTAAANPEARGVEFEEEVMGELVKFVSAHEVGHTIGHPHNWGSSAAYPVDSLRSPTFTATHGTAPSIMDYARFNYIAQPEDNVENFMPDIGEYDVWAVKWGYTRFPDLESAEAREEQLDEWVRERADDPAYFYGAAGPQIDPRSQREDLGRDAVEASRLGLANLKRIMPNLVEWTRQENEDYAELDELYGVVVSQWQLYIGHVTRNIGGVYETPKTYAQEGAVYAPVPRAKQEAAMSFLQEHVFTRPEWLLDTGVLRRIEGAGALERVRSTQVDALEMLLDPQRLARLIESEALASEAGGAEPYPPLAMLEDLRTGLWSALEGGDAIGPFRRNLQRAYLEELEQLMHEESEPPSIPSEYWDYVGYVPVSVSQSDIRAYVRGELMTLQDSIEDALPAVSDRSTRLHLIDAEARIENILEEEPASAAADD